MSRVSWAFEKYSCSQGAHKPGFRPNTVTEDTKQSSKMVTFILSSPGCSVLSVFEAGVKSSHSITSWMSQATGTSGGTGDTWCLYQTERGRAPNFSPLNGCQKSHLTVNMLTKATISSPPSNSAAEFLSQSRERYVALLKNARYINKVGERVAEPDHLTTG